MYGGCSDIYSSGYYEATIKKKINEINDDLAKELSKGEGNVDNNKVFKLIYEQFVQGLHLSNGGRYPRPY